MEYFNKYTSNTTAGTSQQSYFSTDGKIQTGRIIYKLFDRGEYNYSFLFSNITDSTFADGSYSHCNMICDSWEIYGMNVYQCNMRNAEEMPELYNKQAVTFNGNTKKSVAPGEFFSTDEIRLDAEEYEYICLEIVFSGDKIPYHEECIISEFVENDSKWSLSKLMPVPSIVGCDKNVDLKIGFLGDSITQGIGTEFNSYRHWCSELANKLGKNYSYWNLGIGYARAADAATDGAWLFKVKQTDLVFLCLGVNDILHDADADTLKNNLAKITDYLIKNNIKVIVQTVPPFDYRSEHTAVWNEVNDFIKNELSKKALAVFDNNDVLKLSDDKPNFAKYGGHPDAEGCSVWADALYKAVEPIVSNLCSKL